MVTSNTSLQDPFAQALSDLARLRRFSGPPAEFWPAFLAASGALAGAAKGALILRDSSPSSAWKKLGDWSPNTHADRSLMIFTQRLTEIGEACAKQNSLVHALEDAPAANTKNFAVAVRLQLARPEDVCIAAFLVLGRTEPEANEALLRLQLVADTPASFLLNHAANQAKIDVEKFAASLDVLALINNEKRFLAASLALANALATRYSCDRVSLGWLEKGYIRLKTISRTERFDKHMAAVKSLEMVMEESLDQDDEIVFPAPDGAAVVFRDHENFAREQAAGNICSVPLRIAGKPVAVLTFERRSRPFTPSELQQFRLCADQSTCRLADLKRHDRWIGARLLTSTEEKLAAVLGPEKTWPKVFAVIGVVAFILLFFVPFTYRVEGNFILRSDNVSFLTAPFDGYIQEVLVRPGDQVKSNDVLLRLNADDLLLEEAAAIADQNRYLREAEKARATNALAEMRIAMALSDQAKARLDLVRHRVEQAGIRSAFEGVVVEGDLRERIGAPIKQGDPLFKVARTDSLYVEAEINQRDIHEILNTKTAQIAFVTQPHLKYPVNIDRIEPAAFPKEGENVFIVRGSFVQGNQPWWRPGMSGLCKIEAGDRTLFWILSHRTVEFLRLWLWW